MQQCRYWVKGRGCYKAENCHQVHDPIHRDKNLCHRFQRGRCENGDLCARIHLGWASAGSDGSVPPPPQEHPPPPITLKTQLVANISQALSDQLNADVQDVEMDITSRKRKWMCFYQRRLHPDTWTGWPAMEEVMTEVAKELNAKRSRYEDGQAMGW